MCKFKDEFLLCTCLGDTLNDDDVGWILFRRKENKKREPVLDSIIIGSRELPSDEQSLKHKEKFEKYLKEFREWKKRENDLKKLRVAEKDTQRFLNTTANILFQLNNRSCFDKEIDIVDKDVLSIKLDNKLELWVELIYRKNSWRLAKFSLNTSNYLKIISGKIKSTQNNV